MDGVPVAIAADEPLWSRSFRFVLTVITPIFLAFLYQGQQWAPYALIASIAAFSTDTGGKPLPRLIWMASSALALVAGAALGGLVGASPFWLCLAFSAAGVVYALTESGHQVALTLARFFHIALALSALYMPPVPVDGLVICAFVVLAWVIAISWDALIGQRLASSAPHWRTVAQGLKARELERVSFALAVAVAVPAAYLASSALSLEKPYWTMLAMVFVLRVDFLESGRLMAERFAGTVLGVVIAGALGVFFPHVSVLTSALVIAALLRWPAQQRHGLLGVAALTAFVMLALELALVSTGRVLPVLEARIVDTAVGCGFAAFALLLERLTRRTLKRFKGQFIDR